MGQEKISHWLSEELDWPIDNDRWVEMLSGVKKK